MERTTTRPPCLPRFATARRPERATFGTELIDVAERLKQPLMPWQEQVALTACELLPNGRPAYREVFVTVPRQSGKTTLFLSWQIHRCLYWPTLPQRSMFTAQTGKDARDKWLDELFPQLEESELAPLIRRINRGIGNESVQWKTGSLIRLLSTASGSGHSKTIHQAVLDEIWHDLDDRREQGLRPAMITVPDAQLLICSTAGTNESVVYNRKVIQGRQSVEEDSGEGVAYFEWSAPDEWDPEDEESWWSFMPALGHTIGPEAIRAELHAMEPGEFKRAYGNRPTAGADLIFPPGAWEAVNSQSAKPAGRIRFGFDVTEDRSQGAISACGGDVIELIDAQEGVDWIVPRCKELRKRHGGTISTDFGGPAGILAKELNLTRREKISGRDINQACAGMYDAIIERKVTIRHDPRMDLSVEGAIKRPIGDNWVWSRKSGADSSPLWSATLALRQPGRSGGVTPVR